MLCRGAVPSQQLVDKKTKLLVDALLQHGIKVDEAAKTRLYQYCESSLSSAVKIFQSILDLRSQGANEQGRCSHVSQQLYVCGQINYRAHSQSSCCSYRQQGHQHVTQSAHGLQFSIYTAYTVASTAIPAVGGRGEYISPGGFQKTFLMTSKSMALEQLLWL